MRGKIEKVRRRMVAAVLGLGAGLASVAAFTTPAAAQPWGYFPPPPPPPGWGHYHGGPWYYPPYRPRVTFSDVCITSRGTCDLGRPLRSGTPCRCFIPGFGPKRGQVP
jgi:hypothetical protein